MEEPSLAGHGGASGDDEGSHGRDDRLSLTSLADLAARSGQLPWDADSNTDGSSSEDETAGDSPQQPTAPITQAAARRAPGATARTAAATANSSIGSDSAFDNDDAVPFSPTWLKDRERNLAALAAQRSLSSALADGSLDAAVAGIVEGAAGAADAGGGWLRNPKHFFILSSSGKPIFSYHGDENSLASLMALVTALVSVVEDQGDTLHHLLCGTTLIVFMTKGPLVLMATSRLAEPVSALQRQLDLLYCQVQLVVTTGLERILLRNPSYDARPLLQGVGSVLGALIRQEKAKQACIRHQRHPLMSDAGSPLLIRLDSSYLLGSFRPLPMAGAERLLARQALAEGTKSCPLAHYALLMVGSHVIVSERARQQPPLEPLDVMLLANFVTSNYAYRYGLGEAFCPVCLPGYNPDAFLHAHIDYLDRSAGIYLVLLAGCSESFKQLSAARLAVGDHLVASGAMRALAERATPAPHSSEDGGVASMGDASRNGSMAKGNGQAVAAATPQHPNGVAAPLSQTPSSVSELGSHDAGQCGYLCIESLPKPIGGPPGSSPLWHLVCHFPSRRQLLSSEPCPWLSDLGGRQLLASSHARLLSLAMDGPEATKPNRLVWLSDDRLAMLASLDSEIDLYIALDPLTDEALAVAVADALRRHFSDKRVQTDLLL